MNLTFSESRFAQNVSARSIASKFCEAGLRVTESPGKKRLVHLPLPNPATPHPIFPKQVYLFQNRDCSLRELHVVGSWQSKLLADASVQELSNLPGGALDGQGDDTRLHDRADSSYWKVWLFPGTKDPITENISKLGAFRTPAVKFTGTLDNLPIREAFRGKMLGTKHPPGNLFYMHGSGIESLWVASDANYPPDELLLGFSVWGAVKGRLEFTGDGGVIYQAD